MAKSRKNVTSVRAAGFSGGLSSQSFLLKTGKTELSFGIVRFRSPSLLSSEAIDGRRRDLQMNEGNSRAHRAITLFECSWLQAHAIGEEDGK
jgi:hypothetical protein